MMCMTETANDNAPSMHHKSAKVGARKQLELSTFACGYSLSQQPRHSQHDTNYENV